MGANQLNRSANDTGGHQFEGGSVVLFGYKITNKMLNETQEMNKLRDFLLVRIVKNQNLEADGSTEEGDVVLAGLQCHRSLKLEEIWPIHGMLVPSQLPIHKCV